MPNLTLMDAAPAGLGSRCDQCRKIIMWAAGYAGHRLAFDPHPIPRHYDTDGTGWIPGLFSIAGHTRRAYAPLPMHPADKQLRASHVIQLHHCVGRAA